ncbi:myo-inositol 2-dehydrogenase/D-chiro-inositol 1-dehydrogenase [Neobacillus niacini]|uniref:Gfo/Idh/MocA family protein n=1 Tax=Neobacillus driksii TaxID=3035913 RepID=UPI002781769F|nr:Gfo/Idh/MocA family oxidoreductase [Neobacillus niacini]MDQ0972096.1 myo-inositol 2-dehydrogenase/D-chiro-inositol 1-dehydrogenase [Neobacillus niacini]
MKVGIIGTGWFAKTHAAIFGDMDGVEVTAFCGTSIEKAEKEARNWSNAKGYSNVDEMLEKQKLDAVYICVPPMAHGDIEFALIERNIPFFVEKPLGIDEQPLEIAKRIEEKGLITSVGYHWRYKETTKKALSLLQDRKVGMALGYWMGDMPMVPWWRDVTKSGGQFVEQTTHIVDLLRFLCGDITEVYAAYSSKIMQEKVEGTTAPDVGSVTMKLQNGMVATISNTCILTNTSKVGLDLFTEEGIIELRNEHVRDIKGKQILEHKEQVNPYIAENEIFLEAVRTGNPTGILSDYKDSLKTHTVTLAANRSAISGQPIRLGFM